MIHQSAPAWAVFALCFIVGATQFGVGHLLQRHDERVLLLVAGLRGAGVNQVANLLAEVFHGPSSRPAHHDRKETAL
mgnify:CR=1 FL=1